MGLLDFLKKQNQTQGEIIPPTDEQTIYFKDGKMYKVYPSDQESWYDARYLVSDGKLYDLEKVEDIQRIPIPNFDKTDSGMQGYGVTGSLDYVIRMKAGNARKKGLVIESDELYKKAIILMQASGILYDVKPYLYFAKDLLREGRFEESEKWEKKAYKIVEEQERKVAFPYASLSQKNFFDTLEICKQLKVDYVQIPYHSGTCEKCALYHGRVYCISGKDRRFPKFPDFIKRSGHIHEGCRHSIAFFDYPLNNKVFFRNREYDAIEISNRPFIDDRTQEEKQAYAEVMKKIETHKKPYISDDEKEYYHLKFAIPEMAPKSLSGYVRMKNSRSKNFLNLAALAKEKGIVIK